MHLVIQQLFNVNICSFAINYQEYQKKKEYYEVHDLEKRAICLKNKGLFIDFHKVTKKKKKNMTYH